MISIAVFTVLLIFTFSFFGWNVFKVKSNISMGKPLDRSDRKGERLKTMLLVAFGQKKNVSKHLAGNYAFFYLCSICNYSNRAA